MSEFDPNADPERIAARAAELALEQHDRFRHRLERKNLRRADLTKAEVADVAAVADNFYSERFEIGISNKIASLMCAYAVLKGYVTPEQAGLTPTE